MLTVHICSYHTLERDVMPSIFTKETYIFSKIYTNVIKFYWLWSKRSEQRQLIEHELYL